MFNELFERMKKGGFHTLFFVLMILNFLAKRIMLSNQIEGKIMEQVDSHTDFEDVLLGTIRPL
jgi:hypothetical protein